MERHQVMHRCLYLYIHAFCKYQFRGGHDCWSPYLLKAEATV